METNEQTVRNLFEIENARNLNPHELVNTFVPTQAFWRLLSSKHHVILGARGSGKTALAKMLSHDHLALLRDEHARAVIDEKQFIGVYIPTKLEWVGALKNKLWQTDSQKERYFQWRLNLAGCMALIATLESCIRCYCGNRARQARTEIELATALSKDWGTCKQVDTLTQLRQQLEDTEFEKHRSISSSRANGEEHPEGIGPGPVFESELFVPLRRGMTLAARAIGLTNKTTWLVCLDEAEFLETFHQRIINSLMRAHSGNVFFKMTTMPYCHYTLATNTPVSLTPGDDFEYVYLDQDPVLYARTDNEKSKSYGTAFARDLFARRSAASGMFTQNGRGADPFDIDTFLGKSVLLDDKDAGWAPDSKMMQLLKRFCSAETIKRAEGLIGQPNFKPTISRKIHGALLLRESYEAVSGRGEPDTYSGVAMAVRCGDANPRRLVRIFNALLLEAKKSLDQNEEIAPRLTPKAQTRVLRGLSASYLNRIQSEEEIGSDLYKFLNMIGAYMRKTFHEQPLSTDHVSSISIENNITDKEWLLLRKAVQLGLLFPNVGPRQSGELPQREGTFHLAYILAPHFFLLPRRGHSRSLSAIVQQLPLF